MSRFIRVSAIAIVALAYASASASAQGGVLSTAVQKAKNAKAATDAHVEAEQHPEATAPKP